MLRTAPETADVLLFMDEVIRVIRSLKDGKASGPDLIKVCVLKRAFTAIPNHFVNPFNTLTTA